MVITYKFGNFGGVPLKTIKKVSENVEKWLTGKFKKCKRFTL